MPSRTEQLENRRRALQLRCALQRQQLVYQTVAIESKLVGADRLLSVVSGLAKNPLVVMGAVAGAVMIGPWRLVRWASQGALLFKIAKRIWRLFDR